MPWVDPETVGPQNISLLRLEFRAVRGSQHLPDERGPVRAGDHASVDDGRLHRRHRDRHGLPRRQQRASARRSNVATTVARWEPLGTGALGEATRYWTQSDMNTRLVALSGDMLFNRILGGRARLAVPRLHPVALLDDRAGAVEDGGCAGWPSARQREAGSPPSAPSSAAAASSRATRALALGRSSWRGCGSKCGRC